jgi:hypothetical protein
MRKQRRHLCIQSGVWSAIVLLIAVTSAAAQPATGHGLTYDSESEVTFEGIVQQVTQARGKQALMGVHLVVDSGGTITRGNQTLVVRNAHGLPLQSPGGRGNRVANAKPSRGF